MRKLLFIVPCFFIVGTAFSQSPSTHSSDTIPCGNTKVVFYETCQQPMDGIQFIHVHENEKTAVEAANKTLEKYGKGCFVTWRSQDDRYVKFNLAGKQYVIDPNRIYSQSGLAASLRKNSSFSPEALAAAWKLSQAFLNKYINGKRLVIAMHNNTEAELTIRSFRSEAKLIYIDPSRDPDDFFLTTDPGIYNFLKARKFNIVLQKPGIKDDGSLSVYAATHKIPYLNIEAQHGHLEQQLEMLDAVMLMLNQLYK